MSNITNVQESVKRMFRSTYNGQELCCNDVAKRYPQYTYNVIRGVMRQLEVEGFLSCRRPSNTKGNITYYMRAYETAQMLGYGKFLNQLKPTEPKNPRLWA